MPSQAQVLLHQNRSGFPDANTPLVDGDGHIELVWLKFLAFLFSNIEFLVKEAIVAAGNRQDTATQLFADFNAVLTTPLNTGVMMPGLVVGNPPTVVWNLGANPLSVYPPDGAQIDALALNAPYLLAAGKAQLFFPTTTTLARSIQLG